ncbi:MAG: tryptophan 2,3-dioxygenase [Chitinophagaceae bacterium]|nr:MAG: tryptophan 2,3-dioxygenase [Chitinophagaceae bacterium]
MEVHYHDYLQLDKILNAQLLESDKQHAHAHDEMLFVVIHQAYELWFKQLHYEIDSILEILARPSLNDNSPELQTVVHRVSRCVTILRVLVHQIDIMETMTPMDFLEFRNMLRPASGFQSWQFKELEARLGLKFDQRHGKEYYTAQLRPEQVGIIKKAESDQSLLQLLNSWLERLPFFEDDHDWSGLQAHNAAPGVHPFWAEYRYQLDLSLSEAEKKNLVYFDNLFLGTDGKADPNCTLSPAANRAALFIMLYRGYPILQLPFQLLNGLLEIDEQLSSWRYRHMNMVHRMIGTRIGTGGSTGKDYLRGAADKHYIFREIAQLNSFLIERTRLPSLPNAIEATLGFVHSS